MPDSASVLETAAFDAFEDLGFLMPDPEPAEATGPLVGMRVAFQGPVVGALDVWADDTVLIALAMNMTGGDALPDRPVQLDALGEMANVICGNVLPTLEDPRSDFRLQPPVPLKEGAPDPSSDVVELGFEGGLVRIRLTRAAP